MSLVELVSQYPDVYETGDQQTFEISRSNTRYAIGPSEVFMYPRTTNSATFGPSAPLTLSTNSGSWTMSFSVSAIYPTFWHSQLIPKKRRILSRFAPFIHMPSLLEQIMDDTAFRMLATDPSLIGHAVTMYQSAQRQLANAGIAANWNLTTFTEPEGQGESTLLLECKVRGKSYGELLDLWGKLSLELFANIPVEVQKKIALVMDES